MLTFPGMSPSTHATTPGPARIRYGPAGWSYKDWEGPVYPKPAPKGFDPLVFMSRWFDTVEVDSTFYRPLARSVARKWAQRVGGNPHFRFTAKLYRRFTHERTTAWTSDEVHETRAGLEALAEEGRLGAVLVQFPWSFRRTPESVEWLTDVLNAFRELPLVLEVRHISWDAPEVLEGLAARGVGIVNIDQPLFKNSIGPTARATSAVGYVRVHGRNYKDWFRKNAGRDARYDYLYTTEELAPWAERVKEISAQPATKEVYVVTNNHFRGQAPANALMIQSLVEERPVEVPETLLATFPDTLGPHAAQWEAGPPSHPSH